jgi:hypothetical protein
MRRVEHRSIKNTKLRTCGLLAQAPDHRQHHTTLLRNRKGSSLRSRRRKVARSRCVGRSVRTWGRLGRTRGHHSSPGVQPPGTVFEMKLQVDQCHGTSHIMIKSTQLRFTLTCMGSSNG